MVAYYFTYVVLVGLVQYHDRFFQMTLFQLGYIQQYVQYVLYSTYTLLCKISTLLLIGTLQINYAYDCTVVKLHYI